MYNSLMDTLKHKADELQEFISLTSQQRLAVAEENMQELDNLLQKKQQIINRIDRINEKIFELENSLEPGFLSKSAEYQNFIEKINGQLIKARELDQKVRTAFEGLANKTVKTMDELRLGRRAVEGYYKRNAQVHGYFLDRKK